ncbi:MAG: c-type cytochrome [Myxococcota bacterium]
MRRSRLIAAALAALGLTVSSVALGLPWDVDMADGQQVKGYSMDMRQLPEGTVAQPSRTSPKGFAPNFVRGTPEADALTNPLAADEATLGRGKQMYGVYCTPCHGDGTNLGPVAASAQNPRRLPGVMVLGGPTGILKARNDGYVYLTIRNGGMVMPTYGWAMSDEEIWSVVSYVRTLPNAQYVPPEAP